MKTSISYRHADSSEKLESAMARHLSKMEKLLKVYAPDLVQIHGSFEKRLRQGEHRFSVNLSLPTGTLHATGSGPDAAVSARAAFSELESQIKKHQARLRKGQDGKRRGARVSRALA